MDGEGDAGLEQEDPAPEVGLVTPPETTMPDVVDAEEERGDAGGVGVSN